jgi:hypothetical protein
MKIGDLADRLPSPEQTLEALGLQRIDSSWGVGRLAAAFGLGIAIGIGIGALFLPFSESRGREEREEGRGDGDSTPPRDNHIEADHPYG